MDQNENTEKMSNEEYLDRRRDLIRIREMAVDSYDKSMLQISLVGLTIIFSLFTKFQLTFGLPTVIFLIATVVSLGIVAIVTLIGFMFSKKNMDFKINDLDVRYVESWSSNKIKKERFSPYKTRTERLNFTAFWSLMFAIFSIVSYSVLVIIHFNTKQEDAMADKIPKKIPDVVRQIVADSAKPKPISTDEKKIVKAGQTEVGEAKRPPIKPPNNNGGQ